MIIEIEGYQIKAFVSGKKCTAGKLQWQMKKVMEHIGDDQHFVSLFCHLFDYEEIVCEIFSQLKTIYIIDYTEKKQKEIVLYEVVLINYCPAYE